MNNNGTPLIDNVQQNVIHNRIPAAHISKREQVGIGGIFSLAALIMTPAFWLGSACSRDGLIHVSRIAHLGLNLRDGLLFTQWGQHFMRGYGYPIFQFYAPLTYWATMPFHYSGLTADTALRLTTWIILLIAGWGSYNLGRRYFSPFGAFIMGVAYMFAPYLLHDALERGAIPELLGLALLPWALAAADIALDRRTPRAIGTAVFTFSLTILAHNIIPNFGFLILLGLAAAKNKELTSRKGWVHALWPALLIIILSLSTTAFFWLPAFLELEYTQIRHAHPSIAHWWPQFGGDFIPLARISGWPQEPADPALANPVLNRMLGLGQTILALIGIVLLWKPRYRRRELLLWGAVVLVSLFFTLESSLWFWVHLPLPMFVQLPSRFLGPASLGVAILAGIPAEWLAAKLNITRLNQYKVNRHTTLFIIFFGVNVTAVVVSGWLWLYPIYCNIPSSPMTAITIADAALWTDDGLLYRCEGECLGETTPRWVKQLPDIAALTNQYATGQSVNRLLVPETAVLNTWQSEPDGDSYSLHLSEAQTLTYRAFYFPGWQASINGVYAPLSPHRGDGLIQIDVPAGDVQIVFHFGLTSLRQITLLFSILITLVILIWSAKKTASSPVLPTPVRAIWIVFLLSIAVLFMFKAIVDKNNTPIRAERFVNGRLQNIDTPLQFPFEGEFTHLGYNGVTQTAADDSFIITQYWTPQRGIGAPYFFRLQVADDAGRVWNMPFTRPSDYVYFPGKLGWRIDRYVRDAYQFQLLPGTPPGKYWLESFIFRTDTDLSLIPEGIQTAANPSLARIGKITITTGDWNVTADNAQVDTFTPTEIDNLTLLGWTVPNIVYRSGETAQLDLLWQNHPPSLSDRSLSLSKRPLTTTLWLRDGNTVTHHPITIGGTYPTTEWPNDAVVRDQVGWRLPAKLKSGTYSVWLGANEPTLQLGTWQIDAPPHDFTPPLLSTSSSGGDAIFTTTFAELTDYNVEMTDGSIALTLIWHALATADESYRVFVHLRDADGNNIAQSDAIPDNWTRPTTGWVADEYIRDPHTLTAPAGTYDIAIGWYDAATGIRLGDKVIGELTIE